VAVSVAKAKAASEFCFWVVLPAVGLLIILLVAGEFWVKLLVYAGVTAIGAIGLNLLTGNTGQISLGQPFFMGIGGYTAAFVGQDLGLPFPVWLGAAIIIPALVGVLVGCLVLGLRGNFLIIVTFALVLIGQHVFRSWGAVTHGASGRSIQIGIDFFGGDLSRMNPNWRDSIYLIIIWTIVGIIAWLAHNLTRSRIGRALMAIRDREVTAEVIGIDVARFKIIVFTISSGIAGLSGALYVAYTQYTNPSEWGLLLGVQYLAVIVVGGMGSVAGSIVGALIITVLPYCIELVSPYLPFVAQNPNDPGIITVFALNQILFGAIIILFLMFAPRGLVGLFDWRHIARGALPSRRRGGATVHRPVKLQAGATERNG
jgi:branched-chain amino acid transport system permease protein